MIGLSANLCLAAAAGAQGRGPRSVEVESVVEKETMPTLDVVGRVRPRIRAIVAAEVAGLVVEIGLDEGDRVTRGQVLCILRDLSRRTAHDGAVAAQARLAAVVAVRRAEMAKAEFEYQRVAKLWEQKQGTEMERVETQSEFDAAKGRVDEAVQDVEGQKAVVARLADELDRTKIRAPFDGFVVRKLTEIGAWLPQGGGVVELIDLSTVRIRVRAPEDVVSYCTLGAEVVVTIDAIGRRYQAAIARVIPEAHERARTFPTEIDIPNPTGELKSGMLARVAIPAGRRTVRIVVPKDAIVSRGAARVVFVVRRTESGDVATPTPVIVVAELLDYVAVEAGGIAPGDRVIVRGNENMFTAGPVIATPRRKAATTQPVAGPGPPESTAERSADAG